MFFKSGFKHPQIEFLQTGGFSLVVRVLNRLLAVGLGMVLARMLGTQGYGIYAYVFAILSVLLVVADLGIGRLTIRDLAGYAAGGNWHAVRHQVARRMLLVLGISLFLSLMGAILAWVGLAPRGLGLGMVLLPLSALVVYVGAALRGLSKISWALSLELLALPGLAALLLLALFLLLPQWREPEVALAGQILVTTLVLGCSGLLLGRTIKSKRLSAPADRGPGLSTILKQAAPFALIAGIGVLNAQVGIVMVGYYLPADQVGIFRVALLGAGLVGFGLQAANAVLPTQFARLRQLGDRVQLQQLVTLSARLILLSAVPVALVLMVWGGTLAAWLFGAEFGAAGTALLILAGGELVGASMGSLGFLLSMSGEEKSALRVLAGTAAVNVVLNVLLIPGHGIEGAAMASALCQGLRIVLLYRLVRRRLNLQPSPFTKLA